MSRSSRVNLVLVLLVVIIAAAPLVLGLGRGEEPFSGADAQAESGISEVDPGYEPWFSSVFEPPSGEVESGLFALQAALGAGVLGYCFGVVRTRRRLQGERPGLDDPTPPESDRAA
ncbi:energy-coupling factor ABC transporter substrate-binding protein [Actinomycetospora sp. CA-084318]|uniref:energy-coupling factor ABC transporter substrate-binding protein n=1 Tax=Actinomycetospora sp. CA-084318 TaxID=3239892 RepID=UPI003D971ADC